MSVQVQTNKKEPNLAEVDLLVEKYEILKAEYDRYRVDSEGEISKLVMVLDQKEEKLSLLEKKLKNSGNYEMI